MARTGRNADARQRPADVYAGERVVRVRGKIARSLEVGKLADLAVLSKDYLKVPVEEIEEIEAVMTFVSGKASIGSLL